MYQVGDVFTLPMGTSIWCSKSNSVVVTASEKILVVEGIDGELISSRCLQNGRVPRVDYYMYRFNLRDFRFPVMRKITLADAIASRDGFQVLIDALSST